VDAVGDLAILARLLNSQTGLSVLQGDAVLVAARRIDDLTFGHGTVSVDPVASPPTEGSGRVGNLFAVAMQLCR
jgi:hypothetical protein